MSLKDVRTVGVDTGRSTRDERRLTRSAAMIVWRGEDVDAIVRDETGTV